MKKIVVAGVIALIAVALLLWALIAGTAFLWKQLPTLTDDGARIAQDALKKGEDVFPGLQEKVKETSPWLAGKVRDILHAGGLPETDIAGEEILPVPRYPGMIRTAYALTDQKRPFLTKERPHTGQSSSFITRKWLYLAFRAKSSARRNSRRHMSIERERGNWDSNLRRHRRSPRNSPR